MFILVDTTAKKRRAQAQLERNLKSALDHQGCFNIGFRGANFDHDVFGFGPGELWASFMPPVQEDSTKRFWNGFGIFLPERGTQHITVEINIPLETNQERTAGFFAEDPLTGAIYLMHSGKIGGGRKGIGKSDFLFWAKPQLVNVATGEGEIRSGLVIGNIDDEDLAGRIWRFVQLVAEFKEAATSGNLNSAEFQTQVADFEQYRKEFSGRKRGRRSAGDIDYISYHGDVVEALYQERLAALCGGEKINRTILIDLFVSQGDKYIELYEVKTSTARQILYTAIGQLITHGTGSTPKRFLVVPEGEAIPNDLIAALEENRIVVRRFKVTGRTKKTVSLLPP
ncbi:hypothetical protein K9U40_19105 [Xanthobacter autotrophicus]|uniref:hypothetical protein n=1 Tax=Xanthobacter TaxID=279 RepID=UPI0024AC34F2|nr:hypothetical protein [Xanthobacter autotrophicus]MDI4666416.1 hypothetical protein [Xanthobacter autotrophicus]